MPGIGPIIADAIVNYKDFSADEKEVEFIIKNKIQPVFYTDEYYPFGLNK